MAQRGSRGPGARADGTARGRAQAAWGQPRRAAPRPVPGAGPGRRAAQPQANGLAPVPVGRLRAGLLLGVLIVAGVLALHTRTFLLTRLVLSGLRQVSAEEVESDLGLPPQAYSWQVRPWVLRARLLRDPLIEAAQVRTAWPDGLAVRVVERLPVALLLDGQVAWEVDASGRLLRALPDENEALALAVPGLGVPLPMVVGLGLVDPQPGQVVQLVVLQRALAVAGSLGGDAGTQILDVTVALDGTVGVTAAGGVAVNYGDGSAAAQKTAELLGALTYFRGLGETLASCDVSSTVTPACRTAAGNSVVAPQAPAGASAQAPPQRASASAPTVTALHAAVPGAKPPAGSPSSAGPA